MTSPRIPRHRPALVVVTKAEGVVTSDLGQPRPITPPPSAPNGHIPLALATRPPRRPSVLPTLEVPQIRHPSRLRLALRRAYRNFAALVLRASERGKQ